VESSNIVQNLVLLAIEAPRLVKNEVYVSLLIDLEERVIPNTKNNYGLNGDKRVI